MKGSTLFCGFVNFCALTINLATLKPVPDLENYPEGTQRPQQKSNFVRTRRSIPDMDAVNPPYLQTDAEIEKLNREELSDSLKENDLSYFAVGDLMAEETPFNKDDKKKPPQMKEELVNQPMADEIPFNNGDKKKPTHPAGDWAHGEDLIHGDTLPAGEQIQCYKEQNIDPPQQEPIKPILRLKDQRPFADAFQGGSRMLSRPLINKEKGTKKQHGKADDDDVIHSLYSASEKKSKLQKQKSNIRPKNYNAVEKLSHPSVYKPVGVRAEFPVYDEDIDFHPDPLQGILEEKYWLDPQEQEAVIRKYIDLANNMQPPRADYTKRDASREFVPKSVDSKEAFRDAEASERDCPCKEVAYCKDCSRGHYKKKYNLSETNEGESLYGNIQNRKLLSINYGNTEDINGASNIEEGGVFIEADNEGNVLGDKKDNFGKGSSGNYYGVLNGNYEEESQVEGEVPSFTSNYFGRKLLSFKDDDDNTDEDYGEDEDSDVAEYKTSEDAQRDKGRRLNFKTEKSDENYKFDTRRSIGFHDGVMIENKNPNEKYYHSPIILKPSNSGVYEYKLETEKIGTDHKHVKPDLAEEFLKMQKPFLGSSHNLAKYYVPNKFGNLLQKVIIKQKPREKSTTLDPDQEFEIVRNQTYLNVSIAMNDINISDIYATTEMTVNGSVKHNKREQPISLGVKGRRSYQFPLLKHPNVKSLQGAEESGNVNVNDGNNTVSSSTLLPITNSNTTKDNITDSNDNSTINASANITTETSPTETVKTTENGTTGFSTTAKPKKKNEEYDEDSFDAEIANDIVETVIAESQSGSVVGHNLGLCRRNDSVSKYAKVSPESEQLLKKVTECILERIRDRLEGQSCTLLDDELLQFLKWMVLSGESYKDYLARTKFEFKEFKYEVHEDAPEPPASTIKDGQAQMSVTPKLTT